VRNAALDVDLMKPRPRTVGIAGEVEEPTTIQEDRIADAPRCN
jgi:hypothetical protein